jgi:hypothetical protein
MGGLCRFRMKRQVRPCGAWGGLKHFLSRPRQKMFEGMVRVWGLRFFGSGARKPADEIIFPAGGGDCDVWHVM